MLVSRRVVLWVTVSLGILSGFTTRWAKTGPSASESSWGNPEFGLLQIASNSWFIFKWYCSWKFTYPTLTRWLKLNIIIRNHWIWTPYLSLWEDIGRHFRNHFSGGWQDLGLWWHSSRRGQGTMECFVDLDGKPILSLLHCHRCRNNAAGWQMSLRRVENSLLWALVDHGIAWPRWYSSFWKETVPRKVTTCLFVSGHDPFSIWPPNT